MKSAAVVVSIAVLAGCSRETPEAAPSAPSVPTLVAAPYTPDSGSIAIQCGSLIDGLAAEPAGASTVIIRNGRIESVAAGLSAPQGLPLLDLHEYTCLPGLIDMHTHVTESSEDMTDMKVYLRRTPAEQQALSAKQAGDTLRAGFTAIRNVGNYEAWTDRTLRDEINAGKVAGPRMQVVGYYLTIPQGGGDLIIPGMKPEEIPARYHGGVARTPEEFRKKAQEAIDGGADALKVIASGAVLAYGGVPGSPEVDEPSLKAIADVAHAANRKLAAHAHGALSIKQAIRAGADTIEHASLIDDEGIQMARDKKVALAMDVYNGDFIDTEGRKQKWPEEFLRKNIETTEAQRQAFTRAHAAGVPIVYATDAGVFPHGLNARQFPIMVQRGMTPMAAIQSATSVAAHYMGWGDRVGALAPGRFGDLIAVKDDPLQDVARLQDIAAVIKGGLVFKLPSHGP
jgi:imidazolonepropionase-like amidohydrolase